MKRILLFCMAISAATSAVRSQNTFPSSGNVGIGTLSPASLLEVKGNALINGNTVGISPAGDTASTVLGRKALQSSTTGTHNTAVGNYSLNKNATGSNNTALGTFSLVNNTTGGDNAGIGAYSLAGNTEGFHNTAVGSYSLSGNSTGSGNTAVGFNTLFANRSSSNNTAIGAASMYYTTGTENVAVGNYALTGGHDLDGRIANNNYNVAVGYGSMRYIYEGSNNSAAGYMSLFKNETGHLNTTNGSNSMFNTLYGGYNTVSGAYGLYTNVGGNSNTASGYAALYQTTASFNTGVGTYALYYNTTGSNNTSIGYSASPNTGSLSNTTAIGYFATATASNQVRIGNSSITSIGGYTGWTNISDGRVKKNVKENVPGLSFIKQLRAVTYNLDLDKADDITGVSKKELRKGESGNDEHILTARKEKEQQVYTGFIAQEVAKAADDAGYNFSGVDQPKNDKDLYGLRYAEFVVPLVKAVQELSQQNEELQKQITELKALVVQQKENNKQVISLTTASIEQNVPNPFENNTTIHYVLPAKYSNAKIIFSGTEGKVLKQVNLSGYGKGSIMVRAADLSAGVYQYSLLVNDQLVQTRQMILSK
jgi:trimeric autotransporter adhesin